METHVACGPSSGPEIWISTSWRDRPGGGSEWV